MKEMGVRELKATLSETLRAVGRGEPVRVTVRGKPLADIVAVGTDSPHDRLDRLFASGRATPPSMARPARAPRLADAPRPASEFLLAERDAER